MGKTKEVTPYWIRANPNRLTDLHVREPKANANDNPELNHNPNTNINPKY